MHVHASKLDLEKGRQKVWEATWPHHETLDDATQFYSPLEGDLLAAFWYYGLDPELQVQFGRYRVDFLFPREHVVCEVDGRDWHRDRARERARTIYLRDTYDLVVTRVTGGDVWRDPLRAATRAKNAVEWISERLHLVGPGV